MYGEMSNLEKHLCHYTDQMLVFGCSDATFYKVFLRTLEKVTHGWYHQVLTGSITCFEELTKTFKDHFRVSQPFKKETSSLSPSSKERMKHYETI